LAHQFNLCKEFINFGPIIGFIIGKEQVFWWRGAGGVARVMASDVAVSNHNVDGQFCIIMLILVSIQSTKVLLASR